MLVDGPGWLATLPIFNFALQCHLQAVTIFDEMSPEAFLFGGGKGTEPAAAATVAAAQQQQQLASSSSQEPLLHSRTSSVDVECGPMVNPNLVLLEPVQIQAIPLDPKTLGEANRYYTAKLQRFLPVVTAAIGVICAVLYTIIGIFGYISFPGKQGDASALSGPLCVHPEQARSTTRTHCPCAHKEMSTFTAEAVQLLLSQAPRRPMCSTTSRAATGSSLLPRQ